MAGWIDVVFPSSVVARLIDRSFPPCVPVCSPVEEKTSVPLGRPDAHRADAVVRGSAPATISWRASDASSDIGSRTSAAVSSGASSLLTVDAACLFAALTAVSIPEDFRYQAPAARPADSTAMPIHMTGRPTENCLLDATVPPRGTAGGTVPCSTPLPSAGPDANLSVRAGDASWLARGISRAQDAASTVRGRARRRSRLRRP